MSSKLGKTSLDLDKQRNVEFVEESRYAETEREREEKALVRKIDLYLLPTMWLMYLLSYMDVSTQSRVLELAFLLILRHSGQTSGMQKSLA